LVEALAVLCTLMMAGGQIMLKIGLSSVNAGAVGGVYRVLLRATGSPKVWLGVLLYLISALLWVWILTQRPLSYIYPFLAFSYGFALIGSSLFLGEKVCWIQWVGIVVIALGIFLVSRVKI